MINSYLQKLLEQRFPTPDLSCSTPKDFANEKLRVNKDSSILLHDEILASSIPVEPHPAFEYEIISSKYFVSPQEEPQNHSDRTLDTLNRVVKFRSCPTVNCDDSVNINYCINEQIECTDFTTVELKTSDLKHESSFLIEIPKLLHVPKSTVIYDLPEWNTSDSLNVFDIEPEAIQIPDKFISDVIPKIIDYEMNSIAKYQLDPCIIQNQSKQNIPHWKLAKWSLNYEYHYPNIKSFIQFIIDQNRITESSKYFVYPVTRFDHDHTKKRSIHRLREFFMKHFHDDELWQLPKHILIEEMSWNPFGFDLEWFIDRHVEEVVDVGQINQLSKITVWREPKLKYIPTKEDLVNDPYDSIHEEPPKEPPPTHSVHTQFQTNMATYQNDTAEIEKLASLRKKRRIGVDSNIILPPEISTLLFVDHNNTPAEEESFSIQEPSEISKEEKETINYNFSSTQYIIINQTLWDMDYQLANRLNDTIQIIESKLSYPIDIIINASIGIVITSSEYLIQVDSDNNFLILKELIHCKMYLLEVYVVATISNPWFLEHCGENFQKLQILALGFDIKIVLVIKEELFQYIIDLINLEGPEVVNNFIDQTSQECSFLCECGLSYFQSIRIIEEFGFHEFITSNIQVKLDRFSNIIPSELLVCI